MEVVGCGRDRTVKFRVTKYDALSEWHQIQPVYVFVYNSTSRTFVSVYWDEFVGLYRAAKETHGVQVFSSDQNEYVPIPFDWLLEKGDNGVIDG